MNIVKGPLKKKPVKKSLAKIIASNGELNKFKEKLNKVKNLYAFISQVNQDIVRVKDETKLFHNSCTIALKFGKFKMAWIGLFDDQNKTINLVEQKGIPLNELVLFKNILYQKKDPQDYVLRTRKYYLCNDIEHSLELKSWKSYATKHGIKSCIVLPIKKSGNIIGTFNLYSTEINFSNKEEIALLLEVAGDISFAMDYFEKERKRKELEKTIVFKENRFRILTEKGVDMKTLSTAEGMVLYGSPSITKVLGYNFDEYMHKCVFNFIHPDDIKSFQQKRKSILKTPNKSFHFKLRIQHKKGNWVWCEGSLTNMFHEQSIRALVSNFLDISERKLKQEEEEFDKNNLNALINNTKDLMWSVDRNFKLITSNQSFHDVVLFMSGRLIKKGSDVFTANFSEDKPGKFKTFYERAFSGETFTVLEHTGSLADPWSEISFNPIYLGDKVIGTACFSKDITERKLAEQLINESEVKYRSFFENSMEGLLISITDGRILDANPAACSLFQMTKNEIYEAGRFGILDSKDPQLKILLNERRHTGSAKGELTFIKKNGDKFTGEISSNTFKDAAGENRTSMIIRDVTESKRAIQEIIRKEKVIKNLLRHLLHVKEEERLHISREIHDELGQQLAALKMDIDWVLHKQKNASENIVEKLKEMLVMSNEILNSIRRISSDLRPAIIEDLGLVAALEWLCDEFERKKEIPCSFSSTITERKFENDFSITAYRILQESLTNISKHAEAKSVHVSVKEDETQLFLEITDDGKGVSANDLSTTRSFGILGMKERAAMLEGTLIVEGVKNKGTRTKLILPLKNEYINS